jgi:hypothetical protein
MLLVELLVRTKFSTQMVCCFSKDCRPILNIYPPRAPLLTFLQRSKEVKLSLDEKSQSDSSSVVEMMIMVAVGSGETCHSFLFPQENAADSSELQMPVNCLLIGFFCQSESFISYRTGWLASKKLYHINFICCIVIRRVSLFYTL